MSTNTLKVIGLIFILLAFVMAYQLCRSSKDVDNPNSTINKETNPNDEYYRIKKSGEVRIGWQVSAPPFNYIENGKRAGFDFEMAKLIFSQDEFGITNANSIIRSGFGNDLTSTFTYDSIPYLLFKEDNRGNKTVDIIMGGLTYYDEDLEGVVYTIPYIDGFGYSLISKKTDALQSIDDIKNKRIGYIDGDVDVEAFTREILPKNTQLVPLPDSSDTWLSDFINNDLVDVIIYDFPFAAKEIANMKSTNIEIKIAKIPGSNLEYKIGLRKGNEELLSALNSAITKVRELPKYDALIKEFIPVSGIKKIEIKESDQVYVVKKGDWLSKIAEKCLRDKNRYEELAQINNIGQPNLIFIGQKLKMPTDSKCK